MTPERAREILRAWRKDVEEVESADLAEALQLAEDDRSLGAWLAGQQEADANVRAEFGKLEPPASLKEKLMARLEAEDSPADTSPTADPLPADPPLADPSDRTVPFPPPAPHQRRRWRVAPLWSVAATLLVLLGITLFVFDPSPLEAQPELAAFLDEARSRADSARADLSADRGQTVRSWDDAEGLLHDQGVPAPAGMPAQVREATPLFIYSFRWEDAPVGATVVEHPERGRGTVFSISRTIFPDLSELREDPTYVRAGDTPVLAWVADDHVHTLVFAGPS